MELDEAIGRITEIRAQLDRTETFRGYRSLTVAFSGLLGVGGAAFQARHVASPADQMWDYLSLWIAMAALSLIVVVAEILYRCSVSTSPLTWRLSRLAFQQFLPCIVVGAALTGVIAFRAPQELWMLPGLWSLVFSLGVFSSCRLLPKPVFWIGVHYLAAGAVCLAFGEGQHALSPWMMVATFGVGQLFSAGILYFTLEQSDRDSAGVSE